jgi:hypothetical protein
MITLKINPKRLAANFLGQGLFFNSTVIKNTIYAINQWFHHGRFGHALSERQPTPIGVGKR